MKNLLKYHMKRIRFFAELLILYCCIPLAVIVVAIKEVHSEIKGYPKWIRRTLSEIKEDYEEEERQRKKGS